MKIVRNSLLCLTVVLSVAVIVSGCKRLPPKPEGLPKLHPTRITVTFGGEAVEGVNVLLFSQDPNYKWKSGGKTDKNGTAELRTSFSYTGAPEGIFTVAFEKAKQKGGGETVAEMAPVSLIPLKYNSANSTETINIKAGKNEFSFTLDGGEESLLVPTDDTPVRKPE